MVRREKANLERLAAVLWELHARLWVGGMTDAGGFDVLAGLEAADGHLLPYDELVTRSTVIQGNGFVVRARPGHLRRLGVHLGRPPARAPRRPAPGAGGRAATHLDPLPPAAAPRPAPEARSRGDAFPTALMTVVP